MENRMRELRTNARLSQAEVAKLLDVDEGSVNRWERGKRPLSPTVIAKLAQIFKVQSWELFLDRRGLRRLAGGSIGDHEETIGDLS
jgi:transcriptional regulator with XRE-family HTH domain